MWNANIDCTHLNSMLTGGTEDAINAAREALHNHLVSRGRSVPGSCLDQEQMCEEDLYNVKGEREVDVEFSGEF